MSGGGSTPQTSWTVFPRLNNSEASNQALRDRILWWMRVGWMAWYTWLQYYAWLAVCSVYSWPEISSYMNTMICLDTKHQTLPGLGVFSTKSGWLGGTVAATRSGLSLSSRWSLQSAQWHGFQQHLEVVHDLMSQLKKAEIESQSSKDDCDFFQSFLEGVGDMESDFRAFEWTHEKIRDLIVTEWFDALKNVEDSNELPTMMVWSNVYFMWFPIHISFSAARCFMSGLAWWRTRIPGKMYVKKYFCREY